MAHQETEAALTEVRSAVSEFKNSFDAKFNALQEQADRIETVQNRPNLGGSSNGTRTSGAEMTALNGAVRALLAGQQEKANSLFQQANAMSVGSDPDGGYVVHPQISAGMTRVMAEISPIYRLARKIPLVAADAFEEPIDKDAAEANWVAETETRGDTGTPQLGNPVKPRPLA